MLDALKLERLPPATIRVDNGSEFVAKATNRRARETGVELDLSRPDRPIDHATIESFSVGFARSA